MEQETLFKMYNPPCQELVGRRVRDATGVEGKIISVMPVKGSLRWLVEVCIKFDDKMYSLDTQHTTAEWMKKSFIIRRGD